jgi:hypothetical protein
MHDATRPSDPSPAPTAPSSWELATQPVIAPAVHAVTPVPGSTPTGGAGFGGRTPSRLPAIRAGIVLGCALVVAVGAAVVMGASPSSPDPSTQGGAGPSAAPSAGPNQGGNGKPDPFGGRPFNGKGPFGGLGPFSAILPFVFGTGPSTVPGLGTGPGNGDRFGGIGFGRITVTAISGNQLTLGTDDGWARTITVTADTKITKGGQPATVDDVHVGDVVRFTEHKNDDGTWTITNLAVVLPQTAGTVTAVGSDTITITGRDGTSQTIHTTGTTSYHRGSSAANRSDVTVGSTIVAVGERGSDGSLTATTVTIVPARVIGTVSAVNGNTLTISRRDGTTLTVHVSSATTIAVAGVTNATISDVKPGMVVAVEGTQRSDGSLDASAVRGGQPGKVRDQAGNTPKTAPTPSGGAPGATG